jgi:hypothetical protein
LREIGEVIRGDIEAKTSQCCRYSKGRKWEENCFAVLNSLSSNIGFPNPM